MKRTKNAIGHNGKIFLRENAQSPEAATGIVRALPSSCAGCDAPCKLTHVYGKYHLAMLHRQLAMSEEQTTYQQAEQQAAMMRSTIVASLAKNQMTIFHSSPADFLRPCGSKRPEVERMHTQEESTDESIATYREFKRLVEEYADEHFVPSVVEEFYKRCF